MKLTSILFQVPLQFEVSYRFSDTDPITQKEPSTRSEILAALSIPPPGWLSNENLKFRLVLYFKIMNSMCFNKLYIFFSFQQWIVKKVPYRISVYSISVNYPKNQIQESPSIYFILFPHTKSESLSMMYQKSLKSNPIQRFRDSAAFHSKCQENQGQSAF